MSTVWRQVLRRGGGWGLLFLLWLLLASSAHAADPVGPPDAAGSGGGGINVWPVYDERDDPVDRMHVQSGLGPLLAFGRSPNDVVENRAFRPLFYWRKDTQPERLEWEVLYPLMAYSRVEEDSKFQFLQLLNFRHEGSDPKAREDRYELFPVYASGTTETGRKYLAILPFGGSAPNCWFQDEAEFVLFPLYARFVRRARRPGTSRGRSSRSPAEKSARDSASSPCTGRT